MVLLLGEYQDKLCQQINQSHFTIFPPNAIRVSFDTDINTYQIVLNYLDKETVLKSLVDKRSSALQIGVMVRHLFFLDPLSVKDAYFLSIDFKK